MYAYLFIYKIHAGTITLIQFIHFIGKQKKCKGMDEMEEKTFKNFYIS